MKKLVVAWVAGFVFAMALVVRWQLIGNPSESAGNAAAAPEPTDESEPSVSETPAGVRRLASTGWESVRVGAQADLGRLQKLLRGARPDTDPVAEPPVDTLDLTTKGVSTPAE
jgi:hypothetical protein